MSAWKKFSEGVPPKTQMGEVLTFLVREGGSTVARPARWSSDFATITIGASLFSTGGEVQKDYADLADTGWEWTPLP